MKFSKIQDKFYGVCAFATVAMMGVQESIAQNLAPQTSKSAADLFNNAGQQVHAGYQFGMYGATTAGALMVAHGFYRVHKHNQEDSRESQKGAWVEAGVGGVLASIGTAVSIAQNTVIGS